ncbi:MAG: hypothetical protein ACP5SH_17140 [Syntrophobacteraceae bacterium]
MQTQGAVMWDVYDISIWGAQIVISLLIALRAWHKFGQEQTIAGILRPIFLMLSAIFLLVFTMTLILYHHAMP